MARLKRPGWTMLGGVGSGLFFLLALSAWMQIQALRLTYKCQNLRREIEVLDRRRNGLNHRRTAAMSLSRLDRLGRTQFSLQVPRSEQVRLLSDPA